MKKKPWYDDSVLKGYLIMAFFIILAICLFLAPILTAISVAMIDRPNGVPAFFVMAAIFWGAPIYVYIKYKIYSNATKPNNERGRTETEERKGNW